MSAMENHWGKAMGKFESIPKPPSPRLISDGFGFSWPFGRKRRARLAASIARQQELDAFWKAEQIRLNPNMAHLLSGASFEKEFLWRVHLEVIEITKRHIFIDYKDAKKIAFELVKAGRSSSSIVFQ